MILPNSCDFRCNQFLPLGQMLEPGHRLSGQAEAEGIPPLNPPCQTMDQQNYFLEPRSIKGIYKAPTTLASKHWIILWWCMSPEQMVCFFLCSPGLQRNKNLDGQGHFAFFVFNDRHCPQGKVLWQRFVFNLDLSMLSLISSGKEAPSGALSLTPPPASTWEVKPRDISNICGV